MVRPSPIIEPQQEENPLGPPPMVGPQQEKDPLMSPPEDEPQQEDDPLRLPTIVEPHHDNSLRPSPIVGSKQEDPLRPSPMVEHQQEEDPIKQSPIVVPQQEDDSFEEVVEEFTTMAQKLTKEINEPRQFQHHLGAGAFKAMCGDTSIYATHNRNGMTMYGKVELRLPRVWVHSFTFDKPAERHVTYKFKELLCNFKSSLKLPNRAFLQVEDEATGILNEVVIVVKDQTPRGQNFLLFCSGMQCRSYVGKHIFTWINMLATTGEDEETPIVKNIKDGNPYCGPQRIGSVCGWSSEFSDSLSGFCIWMEGWPDRNVDTEFGCVDSGLEVCQKFYAISNGLFLIKKCGLVI